MAGIYVHIPFCKTRCVYCGFYSTTLLPWQEKYVAALLEELRLRNDYLMNEPIETIYFGGGTPSQLKPKLLEQLLDGVRTLAGNSVQEITVECNPDDITPEFATLLYNAGVTRVSMGAQTFNDERLQFLRRRHKASQVGEAVRSLRDAGIHNVSIDLMFGFPGETISDWLSDIHQAVELHPEHISAYSLMYEEGTPLYKMLENEEISEIDEEVSRSMYYSLLSELTSVGYEHYEISNFCRPGYHSRHNSSYWHAVPYLGLGAGAHSYDGLSRQWNISDLEQYIESISNGEIPCEREELDERTRYNDMITTALRTREGIQLEKAPFRSYIEQQARPFINKNLLIVENGCLHLTADGLYVSDDIMAELIMLEDSVSKL